MIFPTPKKYSAEVKNKDYLNYRTIQINFRVIEPDDFSFIPGQFINLQVSPIAYRSYSIVSDYKQTDVISFILTVDHEGLGSNFAKNLQAGEHVNFIGPSGRFVLPEQLSNNLMFISTGTGITPIISMLYQLQDQNCNSTIHLFAGFRSKEDIFYEEILKSFKDNISTFNYHISLTRPENPWSGLIGRVTEHIKVMDPQNTQVFICGNPEMVDQSRQIVENYGVLSESIFAEKFKLSTGKKMVGSPGLEPGTSSM